MFIMNFLDSFLDKIPIIRDMDKKKRILAAGFLVFAIVSLLGILIDAIAEAGGVVALISVAIGFLLMAAIIITDFIMSRREIPVNNHTDEQYQFFDDGLDDYGYQDESSGYRANDGPMDGFDNPDFSDAANENNYSGDFDYTDNQDYSDNGGYMDGQSYPDDGNYSDNYDYHDNGNFESEPAYDDARAYRRTLFW